jgi:hypothetical protein
MAAACSTASPFANPSRLGFQDPDEFTQHLADTAAAWRFFDAGHFSEPEPTWGGHGWPMVALFYDLYLVAFVHCMMLHATCF